MTDKKNCRMGPARDQFLLHAARGARFLPGDGLAVHRLGVRPMSLAEPWAIDVDEPR